MPLLSDHDAVALLGAVLALVGLALAVEGIGRPMFVRHTTPDGLDGRVRRVGLGRGRGRRRYRRGCPGNPSSGPLRQLWPYSTSCTLGASTWARARAAAPRWTAKSACARTMLAIAVASWAVATFPVP